MSWLYKMHKKSDNPTDTEVMTETPELVDIPTETPDIDSQTPDLLTFENFVKQRLPLNGMGDLHNAESAQYWILDHHRFTYPKEIAREKIASLISRATPEEEKPILMRKSGIFDIEFPIKSPRNKPNMQLPTLTITFAGQPFGGPEFMNRFNRLAHHESVQLYIYRIAPQEIQQVIDRRKARQERGFGPTQVTKEDIKVPEFASKIRSGELPPESALRYANIVGYLVTHTSFYVDPPQVKLVELDTLSPRFLQKYRTGLTGLDNPYTKRKSRSRTRQVDGKTVTPFSTEEIRAMTPTLRNLPDDAIRELYADVYDDIHFGSNGSGLNPNGYKTRSHSLATMNAINAVFDRRDNQTHLVIRLNPPDITLETVEELVGPLQTEENKQKNPNWRQNIGKSAIVADRIAVDKLREFFNLSYEEIPPSERPDFEAIEEYGRGQSNQVIQLKDTSAPQKAKNTILRNARNEGQKAALEFFFDMGSNGETSYAELKEYLNPDLTASSTVSDKSGFRHIYKSS